MKPDALIFVSPPPDETSRGRFAPKFPGDQGYVYSPHFYDGLTIYLQRYITWLGVDTQDAKIDFILGHRRVSRNFVDQIRRLLVTSQQDFSGVPTVIGETWHCNWQEGPDIDAGSVLPKRIRIGTRSYAPEFSSGAYIGEAPSLEMLTALHD